MASGNLTPTGLGANCESKQAVIEESLESLKIEVDYFFDLYERITGNPTPKQKTGSDKQPLRSAGQQIIELPNELNTLTEVLRKTRAQIEEAIF